MRAGVKAGPNYITPEQFDQILEHTRKLGLRRWAPENVQACYMVAYWCALRMSEAIRVKGKAFDWERGELYLGRTKTKDNFVPVPPQAKGWLHAFFKEWGPDREVLPGCYVKRVYQWLLKAGRDLDIEALTTSQNISGEKTVSHIFRKSLGKDMLAGRFGKPASVAEVQAQLRHHNPVVTGGYLRLNHRAAADFWEDRHKNPGAGR